LAESIVKLAGAGSEWGGEEEDGGEGFRVGHVVRSFGRMRLLMVIETRRERVRTRVVRREKSLIPAFSHERRSGLGEMGIVRARGRRR
jgi:hypothetical protein